MFIVINNQLHIDIAWIGEIIELLDTYTTIALHRVVDILFSRHVVWIQKNDFRVSVERTHEAIFRARHIGG
ncbi:hypothetical protein DIE07_04420 [Burkholderia sp. Bp9002]|nr:hypothetical protein DIE07_04420 [Burkholderia sp. Bp9002]